VSRTEKLRVVVMPDGRHAYPNVVRYRLPTGATVLVPPTDGTPHTAEVLDLDAYEALARSGALYHGHGRPPGARYELIDHRSAPGG
jgi:hypothetical protein